MSNLKSRVAQRAAAGGQPQSKQSKELAVKAKVATVRGLVQRMRPQFEMALPRHLAVDRFLRTALTAVQRTPKLLDCTRESLLAALLESARLGLEPGTRQAAIVPYGDKATFVVQWQGLVELMYRSGRITSVVAEFIHEGDEWEYRIGDGGGFWHRPNLLGERGEPLLCYAFAELKGGGRSKIVTLARREAEEIRDRFSRAYALAEQHRAEAPDRFARNPDDPWFNSPWHTDFNAMWRKSAVRRLADWVPQSPEMAELLQRESPAGEPDPVEVDLVDGELLDSEQAGEPGPADGEAQDAAAVEQPGKPEQADGEDDGWPPVTKPGQG